MNSAPVFYRLTLPAQYVVDLDGDCNVIIQAIFLSPPQESVSLRFTVVVFSANENSVGAIEPLTISESKRAASLRQLQPIPKRRKKLEAVNESPAQHQTTDG